MRNVYFHSCIDLTLNINDINHLHRCLFFSGECNEHEVSTGSPLGESLPEEDIS